MLCLKWFKLMCMFLLCLLVVPGCSYKGGGSSDGNSLDGDQGSDSSDRKFGESVFAVVSSEGVEHQPPVDCEQGLWTSCGHLENMACTPTGKHIDYDPNDDTPCPVCVYPSAADPQDCEGWKIRYADFLLDIINGMCAKYCTSNDDCFAWEIQNACGSVALPLFGGIDEEPIYFAEVFARENCVVCGEIEQTMFLRRPGSDEIEPVDGATGTPELLPLYRPACHQSLCVLVPAD
jgi:hypothetical protein